jgi:putative DNA methylase
LHALVDAGFAIVAVHPIKSEMSVAVPKAQAKEPIDYDIIMVCRKKETKVALQPRDFMRVLKEATIEASGQAARLRGSKKRMSRNDARVVLMSQVLRYLSNQAVTSIDPIREHESQLEEAISAVYKDNDEAISSLSIQPRRS